MDEQELRENTLLIAWLIKYIDRDQLYKSDKGLARMIGLASATLMYTTDHDLFPQYFQMTDQEFVTEIGKLSPEFGRTIITPREYHGGALIPYQYLGLQLTVLASPRTITYTLDSAYGLRDRIKFERFDLDRIRIVRAEDL